MAATPLDLGTISRRRSDALDRLRALPRGGLGQWPTPIERGHAARGREVWIKRDDLSGLGRGGAKARKIDFLLAHLVARGADELITVAGNVTNLAFDLLPVLDAAQIKATLFIADQPHVDPREREELFAGIRDRLVLLGGSNTEALRHATRAYFSAKRRGGRPFLLLPGVAHPAGVFGSALGFIETVDQFSAAGEPPPQKIFVTAAAGTTIAGFLLAERALRAAGRPPIEVIGVQVHPAATTLAVRALIFWSGHALGARFTAPPAPITIDTRALGAGFGHYDPELARRCLQLEDRFNWQIDPIFGGKTWSVMEHALAAGERALYWHCGYTPEWRALGEAVRRAA